jgi:hypothetical protein
MMIRRTVALPVAVLAAALVAGCTGLPEATPAGPPIPTGTGTGTGTAAAQTTTPAPAPAHAAPAAVSSGKIAAPAAYRSVTATFPVQPTGYATVTFPAPAGWTGPTTIDGVTTGDRSRSVDSRDATGRLLLRFAWEPDSSGGTAAGLPAGRYAALPGYRLDGYHRPHTASTGLLSAGWNFWVQAAGGRRFVTVRSWLLNGVRLTVYTSGPVPDRAVVTEVAGHATAVQFRTYIGHDG